MTIEQAEQLRYQHWQDLMFLPYESRERHQQRIMDYYRACVAVENLVAARDEQKGGND